jgi:phenylpropionate dioxygenase-like ring-hydroxylating dioxygenase large terminal subunit
VEPFEEGIPDMTNDVHTFTRDDYLSDEVWEIERERIFHRGWFLAARGDTLAPGNRTVVDVAGETAVSMRSPTCVGIAVPDCATHIRTADRVR